MKKILLAAVAALAITSCSQNEEFENPSQKAEIKFNTAVTRATAMDTDHFNKFKVYGYAHTGTFDENTAGDLLVDGTFSKDAQKAWTEDDGKKFYWPATDNVTFFGYSLPDGNTTATYTAPIDKGYPSVGYTVADVIASQEDFLIVQQTGNLEGNKDGIALGFKHALTQIAFKLKGSKSDIKYSVTKLALTGIKNSGTYKWGPTVMWQTGETTKGYTIDMTSGAEEFQGEAAAVELTGNDKVLMLIPQAPADNATIEITYTATDANNRVYNDGTVAKAIKLPTDAWGIGERIVFTIALTPGQVMNITGEVSTDGWKDKAPQPGDLN